MNTDWKDRLASLAGSLPVDDSPAPEVSAPEPEAGKKDVIEITYERKGRGGKPATILSGFTCRDDELRSVATKLKQKLATGGSARGGEILLQGDCRERVRNLLKESGYRTKG